jgi:hypothetical protein
MDQWLEIHHIRARDLIREAEADHRRRAASARRRTTPYAPTRRRTASDSL